MTVGKTTLMTGLLMSIKVWSKAKTAASHSGRGSVWEERLLWEQEAAGSNPVAPMILNNL